MILKSLAPARVACNLGPSAQWGSADHRVNEQLPPLATWHNCKVYFLKLFKRLGY